MKKNMKQGKNESFPIPNWLSGLWLAESVDHSDETNHIYKDFLFTLKQVIEQTALLLLVDRQGYIIYASKEFCKAVNRKPEELTGGDYLSLQHDSMKEPVRNGLETAAEQRRKTSLETTLLTKEGKPVITQTYVIPLINGGSYLNANLVVHQDMTRLRQAEKVMKEIVSMDNLTALPNRDKFERDMKMLIDQPQMDSTFAVLFIDLDRFKYYNDTLGHFTGDKLIQVIAQSLVNLRNQQLEIYRYGGDEFTLIFRAPESRREVQQLAEDILRIFKHPFVVSEKELFITASVGISVFPETGKSYNDIVSQAEMAMHYVKERGKDNFQFYQRYIRTEHDDKLLMEKRLRLAAERNDFQLYYQPQIDLREKKVIGMEALLRWNDKELGTISPTKFIPLAEETGLIIAIGDWVLEEACAQAKAWFDQGHRLRIGINISPIQFQRPDFVNKVKHILEKTGLPASLLDLEITENVLLYNREECFKTLERLKQCGITISIDDFGTGYSSLSYLRRFPIDTLKIDQSFIREVLENSNDQAIVTSIIQLAHNMNLRVIAEGVETTAMVLFLNDRDCDEMQGYLYSKPLPAEVVTTFIQQTNPEEVLI
ncbi:PAS domain S-box-containing protein/diguanylate cyclase (GGDEF) domain-containing protein [Evansella caseinilytica]|uniref:PAS domain S-box-containing protein/diguanylate cyclase (GGDEF) domain-containing protein n=1 Tax=Evansella caseinilytica TaxID=1503961 RepID=A0A1H3PPM4_9BACI|nr:GGDEF domain-containing protein [Evansella caseinilytica]SDZ03134.1 PAS domain S-box-containing protein/diguanylate cyclase (GGDEF) domain-containing protein [Evansella caseinilytica]